MANLQTSLELAPQVVAEPRSGAVHTLRRFIQLEPAGALAAVLFVLIFAAVIVGPVFTRFDAVTIDTISRFIPPGFNTPHLLGTDQLGRDLLTRVLMKALEKSPDARYQSAADVIADLRRVSSTLERS